MKALTILLTVCFFAAVFCLQPPPGYPDMVDAGYPEAIAAKWLGADLTSPDAVFQRRSNGKIYFFKGAQYWRLTDKYLLGFPAVNVSDVVDAGYPQSIQEKWNIPGPVKAMFQRADGKIYAFVGSTYYRFTDKYLNDAIVDKSVADTPDAGYPQNIAEKWLRVPTDFDAAFYRANHLIYFFKGTQYYRVRDKYYFNLPADAVETNYPQNIADKWIGLTTVMAAFQRTSSAHKIYFFAGTQYWRFSDKYLFQSFPDLPDAGYPQSITAKFGGVPAVVDAVFQRVGNAKIYIFAGSQYWRLTDKYLVNSTDDTVDAGYPKPISTNWLGVPDNIDGAFQRSNGFIYFFKGPQYYRVFDKYVDPNAADNGPDTVQTGYPQNITEKWFGVPNSIDAVFQRVTDQIYFFKGDQVYRLQDKYTLGYWPAEDVVEAGYPKSATTEFAVTYPLKGFFQRYQSNSELYAFGGGNYWRLKDQNLAVQDFEDTPSFTLTAPTPAPTSAPSPTPAPAPTPAPTPACNGGNPNSVININFANLLASR